MGDKTSQDLPRHPLQSNPIELCCQEERIPFGARGILIPSETFQREFRSGIPLGRLMMIVSWSFQRKGLILVYGEWIGQGASLCIELSTQCSRLLYAQVLHSSPEAHRVGELDWASAGVHR